MKPSKTQKPALSRTSLFLCVTSIVSFITSFGGCKTSPTQPPEPLRPWHVFRTENSGIAGNRINSLTLGTDGKIWVATDEGASYVSSGYWRTFRDSLTYLVEDRGTGTLVPRREVNCIVEGKDHSIWFGMNGGGKIVRFNETSEDFEWRKYSAISSTILAAAANHSDETTFGEVWFCSSFGLMRFVGASRGQGTWYNYTRANVPSLPSNQFWSASTRLYDNSIWFGAQFGGAASVRSGLGHNELLWTSYTLLKDSKINEIDFDSRENVWMATNSGVFRYNLTSSSWKEFSFDSTDGRIPNSPIHAVATDALIRDPRSTRWFGTDSGLVMLRGESTWAHFAKGNSPLPSDTIKALQYDRLGNLWIGTADGLAVYNEKGVRF